MEMEMEMEMEPMGQEGEASGKTRRREEKGDRRRGKGKASGKSMRRIDRKGEAGKDEETMSKMEEEDMITSTSTSTTVMNEKIVEEYLVDTHNEAEAEVEMLEYSRGWESCWGRQYGTFEDSTSVPPMRYTNGGPISRRTYAEETLQIFSVKVAEINKEEGLEWPLHVYGFVAARDCVDHNRNFLFHRLRDNCQILTQSDSFLQLTGPSRAVVYIDPVYFEYKLQVKGRTESEDKMLCFQYFQFNEFYSALGTTPVLCRRCPSKLSMQEFTFALLLNTVEATIDSVKVVKGSWPDHFRGLVVSRTASIAKEDIILLDSRHFGTMPIYSDDDGTLKIKLSRRVVSVELRGRLFVSVVACQVGDSTRDDGGVLKGEVSFKPKKAGKTRRTCKLGFCEVEIVVAWSLFLSTTLA